MNSDLKLLSWAAVGLVVVVLGTETVIWVAGRVRDWWEE